MARVKRWPERMIEAIVAYEGAPFEWGKTDCWCFAMDVAKAVTGTDPWAEARTYRTRTGARRALLRRGFPSIAAALAAVYEEVPPSMAQRGDIGIVMMDGAECACVCEGVRFIGKSERGLVRFQRALVSRAFRVA